MTSLYIKAGAAVALLAAILGLGWHLGSLGPTAALATYKLAQAKVVADAVIAERAAAQVESDRLRKVIATYEQTPIDPIAAGLSHRVYVYAQASSCTVPKTSPHPSGAVSTSTVPSSLEGALQTYIDACSRDALRLNALQAAWPR